MESVKDAQEQQSSSKAPDTPPPHVHSSPDPPLSPCESLAGFSLPAKFPTVVEVALEKKQYLVGKECDQFVQTIAHAMLAKTKYPTAGDYEIQCSCTLHHYNLSILELTNTQNCQRSHRTIGALADDSERISVGSGAQVGQGARKRRCPIEAAGRLDGWFNSQKRRNS